MFCVGGDSLEGEEEGEEEEEVPSRIWIARWPFPVNGADVGMVVLVAVVVVRLGEGPGWPPSGFLSLGRYLMPWLGQFDFAPSGLVGTKMSRTVDASRSGDIRLSLGSSCSCSCSG